MLRKLMPRHRKTQQKVVYRLICQRRQVTALQGLTGSMRNSRGAGEGSGSSGGPPEAAAAGEARRSIHAAMRR